jgi:hypothetical protein
MNFSKKRFFLFLSFLIFFIIQVYSEGGYESTNKINQSDCNLFCPTKSPLFLMSHHKDSTFSYSTSVLGKRGYSLKIVTECLYDSSFFNKGYILDRNMFTISQTIIFLYKDSTIKHVKHPVNHITQKTSSMAKVKVLDNVIYAIGVVETKDSVFYVIKGSGGCNTCSEFYGFYSLKGDLYWSMYSSKIDNFKKETGDYSMVVKRLEISDNLRKARDLKMKTIFPPKESGKEVKLPLR